ncbi:MAG: peptide chain release factor N(5)-glutamine methyltransferase [Saprospiraceae bacterium]|nr:peptide chain release factor N(5)-glutamine methyltransferase [Saprospiraceae bacterium]
MSSFDEIQINNGLNNWVERLLVGEPIQYIAGSAPFINLNLTVNPSVLIPRSETEELAAMVYKRLQFAENLKVLDIGTGSGCIALYLKKQKPSWEVYALDHSEAALNCAKHNANSMSIKLHFLEFDFLEEGSWPDLPWDLIVSNPPYVCNSETETMQSSVLNFEPHMALFAPGDDPLIFYKKIAKFGKLFLKEGGTIYMELNEFKVREIESIFLEYAYKEVNTETDYLNKPRFMICKK